jgi:hypothetical protein
MTDVPPFLKIAVGSTFQFGFELIQKGTRNILNVSGASSIILEWQSEDPTGTPQTPLAASSGAPNADWAEGIIMFTGTGDDIFGSVATISCTVVITGTFNGVAQIIALPIGQIEVLPRPGYPEP